MQINLRDQSMAQPTRITNFTLDFLDNWNNALLIGGCLTYFGSRVVLPLMGKSSSQFPCIEKMSQQFDSLWTFDFSAAALSSFYSLYQDCQVMRSSGNPSYDLSLPLTSLFPFTVISKSGLSVE